MRAYALIFTASLLLVGKSAFSIVTWITYSPYFVLIISGFVKRPGNLHLDVLKLLTILIPSEIYAKSYGYPLKLREEIMQEELSYLFNDDYISRISNLFGILLKDEEKNNIRCQILKKISSK